MVAKVKIVAIVGETASGKSAIAMELAKLLDGEIITADSWTVYKGFNIGTDKPSKQDRQDVKHHLLDVADPMIGYSAAEFKRQAEKTIVDIVKRAKLPIIVGGSGLYIDSILYDYSFLPPSDPALRVKYNAMTIEELRDLVGQTEYDTSDIDLNNKRRIIRLLENEGKFPSSRPIRKDILIVGIKTDRENLKANIEKRVDKMLGEGLEVEVRKLAKKYDWSVEPMKGIGYREFKEYIEDSVDLAEVVDKIVADTLNLAKKQRTWFNRNKSIHWVSNRDEIVEVVTTTLNK